MSSQTIPLNGHVRIQAWEKQEDGTEKEVYNKLIKNLIVDVGKDSILKYLGNISGGGYAQQIGVGDSTTAASLSQTDLVAASNKYWKDIVDVDKTYVRPTLFVTADFGFSEANFTWNEIALCDDQ